MRPIHSARIQGEIAELHRLHGSNVPPTYPNTQIRLRGLG